MNFSIKFRFVWMLNFSICDCKYEDSNMFFHLFPPSPADKPAPQDISSSAEVGDKLNHLRAQKKFLSSGDKSLKGDLVWNVSLWRSDDSLSTGQDQCCIFQSPQKLCLLVVIDFEIPHVSKCSENCTIQSTSLFRVHICFTVSILYRTLIVVCSHACLNKIGRALYLDIPLIGGIFITLHKFISWHCWAWVGWVVSKYMWICLGFFTCTLYIIC